MATTIVTEPKAYVMNHPEYHTPAVAEFCDYWLGESGRYAGLELQFQGEPFHRHLTYREIQQLQESEKEGGSCT